MFFNSIHPHRGGIHIKSVTSKFITILALLFLLGFLLLYYSQTGDFNRVALFIIIVSAAAFLVLLTIHYSTNQQDKLMNTVASILYDKAIALEEEQKKRSIPVGGGSGKASSSIIPVDKPDIDFSDVGGLKRVKEEIRKAIIYPFEHPKLYSLYGKRIGEGILLYGPPGCGKTYIARATAGEANASFINLKLSDVLSKWVGQSEKNITEAFSVASMNKPAILFFDEADAIGSKRGEMSQDHTNRLVNSLLMELDGFEGPKEKVLILAATNEPWHVDSALKRPGRFSKLLFIPPPDHKARFEILKILAEKKPISHLVDLKMIAKKTAGYSCADLEQIVEEAADIPLKEAISGKKSRPIRESDFIRVLKRRSSSIQPWFRHARQQLVLRGSEGEFPELWKFIKKVK